MNQTKKSYRRYAFWGVNMAVVAVIAAACAASLEADVDFPSNTDFDNATSLADIKAEETSGSCDAENVKLTFTAVSGGVYTYDYGTIEAGESKEPTFSASGDFSDSSSFTRDESYDSANCRGPLGTSLI